MLQITFDGADEFEAMQDAEAWCDKHNVSIGRMERCMPRGLLVGDFDIAKWHNLNQAERDRLHGTMTGDMRTGPVTVSIDDDMARKLTPNVELTGDRKRAKPAGGRPC